MRPGRHARPVRVRIPVPCWPSYAAERPGIDLDPRESGPTRLDSAPMTIRICATCGTESPERYRVCGTCGASFDEARSTEEIRRFATVVNSDLKGSTALGERLDPESLREVLTLYF